MMSWHTPTHSSQMKTVGPAISFRTSFWLLLQNEHRRTSSLFFFTDNLFVYYGPSSSLKAAFFFRLRPILLARYFWLRPILLAAPCRACASPGLALRPG